MPLDYRIDVQNPFLEGLKGFETIQNLKMRNMQMQQAQAARQRQVELQNAMARFSERQGKTIEDYRRFMMAYPEVSQQVEKDMNAMTEEQRHGKINRLLPVYAALKSDNIDVSKELIDENISAARYSQDPNELKALELIKKNIEVDPRGALTAARLFLYSAMGEDKFADVDRQIFDAENRGASRNVQSSEILDNGSSIALMNSGDVEVRNAANEILTGQDAIDEIIRGRQFGSDLAKQINFNRETGKLEGQLELRPEVESRTAQAKEQAKSEEERFQDVINKGITAAESTATLRRGIQLLDQVKTGGYRSVALRAKQLFGVEGANEGELSNNLSIAVLSQLKATFGAAFTAEEGKRLERISANFGKSPETNKRLLERALRISENAAKRAMAAANKRGDAETVDEIKQLLRFSLDPDQPATPPETTKPQDLKSIPAEQRLKMLQGG